jgi:hypothetical protein
LEYEMFNFIVELKNQGKSLLQIYPEAQKKGFVGSFEAFKREYNFKTWRLGYDRSLPIRKR